MTDNRKNIKVDPETFEELKAIKPDRMSWPYFLSQAGEAWREQND